MELISTSPGHGSSRTWSFTEALFLGPTHAFKDVGVRFMARMMSALGAARPVTILAATSGDTGGAVAHAFHGVPGVRVLVFFPIGKISPRQEAQITTVGGNVTAVAVRGTFDDCQRLVRQAFADASLSARLSLTCANSINVGRLLPQTFYHVHALMELARAARDSGRAVSGSARAASATGRAVFGSARAASAPGQVVSDPELIVSVPSGNFGNLTAGLIARRVLGMSSVRFVAATNANSVVPEYLAGCGFHPRPASETISTAMDVGNPSNFRRIRHLFGVGGDGADPPGGRSHPDGRPRPNGHGAAVPRALRDVLSASAWSDDETRACIRGLWRLRGIPIDPHTAVGLLGLRRELERWPGARGVVLATAHPAKFAETVEPLIGQALPLPPRIAKVMDRPRHSIAIAPELEAVREVLGTRVRRGTVKKT